MYNFFYQTTCIITGKYYLGIHTTEDLDDGYMGSGIRLWRSIKKHGLENHTQEILFNGTCREEIGLVEALIITWELIKTDKNCMNLCPGGFGGDTMSNHPNKIQIYAKINHKGSANGMFNKKHTAESKNLMSKNRSGTSCWNVGISRTPEEVKSISDGTKVGMRKPESWEKFKIGVLRAATARKGSITIWLAGRKKIVKPELYTNEMKSLGWVRSKVLSITSC